MARSARSRRRAGTGGRAFCRVGLSRYASLGFTNAFAGKKVARTEESAVGAEIEVHSEEEDTTLIETEDGDASIQDEDTAMDQEDAPAQSPAVGADTRATFSFTMDAPTVDDLPDYESLDGHQETEHDCAPTEDATLTNFFHSPVKAAMPGPYNRPRRSNIPSFPTAMIARQKLR
jgi:hypothetical protein